MDHNSEEQERLKGSTSVEVKRGGDIPENKFKTLSY